LYAKLGNCLTMTNGYVDPGVREAFARAAELSTGIGDDTPGLMSVLAGLCGFYALRGEHDDAIRIGLQQLDLAGRTGAQYDRVVASLSRAISCFSVGDYDEADRFVRECRSGYDEDLHGPVAKPAATDPGVQCLGHGSLVFAARGKLEEARQWSEESTALALRRSHVPSRVLSLFYAMMLEQLLRNVDAAEAAADRCLELSKEHGFPYYIPAALVTSGWARARRGDAAAGVQQGAIGLSLLRGAGAVLGQPLYCSMLAEAYRDAGDTPAGLEAVDQGLDVVEATGEIASEPSLHWIRGDLLLDHWSAAGSSAPALGEAEACYRKGIEVARRCGAPMQALGPATSLARLLAQTGRNSEAKKLLKQSIAPIAPAPGVPLLNDAMVMFAQM
jgi:tetratricopeptide (TPR) repeat protein